MGLGRGQQTDSGDSRPTGPTADRQVRQQTDHNKGGDQHQKGEMTMSKREMMMSKREMMRERMAQMGYDEDYFNDVAFAIVQGSDYDEECQRVTDEIAERMGIVNPDPEYCEWDGTDYGLINELVNELTTLGIELLRA